MSHLLSRVFRSVPPLPGRILILSCCIALFLPSIGMAEWRAGLAREKITPERPMWMSGYASRTAPAEGTELDLWAKALVLEDEQGARAVLVTLDIVGIDRDLALAVCNELKDRFQLERPQIAICTSHTHSGPVVGRTLMSMYFLDEVQRQLVADYTADLERRIVALVDTAVKDLAPARIAWGTGHSSIAVNRRTNVEANVPDLRSKGLLKGPVDHEVPVLSIRDPEGKLRGIVFGYACHATVLPFNKWSGDYPGYAQRELEQRYPEATALFFAGCGGDQNPLPRREVRLAEEYGRSLATSVDAVLAGPMQSIDGSLSTKYSEIELALDRLPTRDDLVQQSKSNDKYVAQRAKILLAQVDAGKPLAATYPYPLQVWSLGKELQWVFLGGEVVVDYSLRIKRELGPGHTWVAAYANDVMAYIPSLRVLKEGGYEGGGAMVYYGLPTVWGEAVEELILDGIHKLFPKDAR